MWQNFQETRTLQRLPFWRFFFRPTGRSFNVYQKSPPFQNESRFDALYCVYCPPFVERRTFPYRAKRTLSFRETEGCLPSVAKVSRHRHPSALLKLECHYENGYKVCPILTKISIFKGCEPRLQGGYGSSPAREASSNTSNSLWTEEAFSIFR